MSGELITIAQARQIALQIMEDTERRLEAERQSQVDIDNDEADIYFNQSLSPKEQT